MEAAPHDETIRAGGLELRRSDGLVLAGGQVVQTSVRELRLLVALVDRWGRIVSREELYRLAWGGTLRAGDRSVDVYVHKLRAKLETGAAGDRVHPHAPRVRLPLRPRFTSFKQIRHSAITESELCPVTLPSISRKEKGNG